MHNSKILQIIGTFERKELREFGKFLNSPYFVDGRTQNQVLALFLHIQKYWPDMEHPQLKREKVYPKLYPGEKVVVSKLEKLMSRLLALLRDFIVQKSWETDRSAEMHLLWQIQYFRHHQIKNLQDIAERKLTQSRSKIKRPDIHYFYESFLIEQQIVDDEKNYSIFDSPRNMPDMLHRLDDYYLIAKLKYAVQMLAMNYFIVPLDIDEALVSVELLIPLIDRKIEEMPLLLIYYRAYQMLRAEEEAREQCFHQFRDNLSTHLSTLPEPVIKAMQALIRNYCVSHWMMGDPYFTSIAFPMYREHLDQGYLYYEGKLLPSSFGNLIQSATIARAFDWMRQFLEDYRDRITGTEHPENVYRYNLANYHLGTGAYEAALDCVYEPFEDRFYKIAARQLEIQVLYEMKSDLLESRLEAFKVYVYRLDEEHFRAKRKEGLRNFVQIVRQLLKLDGLPEPEQAQKLETKIRQVTNLVGRDWLLKMIRELV